MAEIERRQITGRIKKARKEAGLTQAEMAEALQVYGRTYQNYESEKSPRVPWGELDKIAKLTGKTTQWIIHGDTPTPFGDTTGEADLRAAVDRLEDQVRSIRDCQDIIVGILKELAATAGSERAEALAEAHQTVADAEAIAASTPAA